MRLTSQSGVGRLLWVTAGLLAAALVLPVQLEAQCGGGGGGGRIRSQPQVKAKYDKASDMTTVSLAPVGEGHGHFAVGAAYECLGKEACTPFAVQMILVAESPHPQYENADAVTLSIDGAGTLTFQPQYGARKDAQSRGGVREVLAWALPTEEFLRIAKAEQVEITLGATRSQLSLDQRRALLKLAKRMEAGQHAQQK